MMKELDVNKPYPTDEEIERMPVMAEEGVAHPEIRSTEWVEELEAALSHAANALDKWPDDDRTMESANHSQAIVVANDLRKLVNAERSRSSTD